MRTFIAIEIPRPLQQKLQRICDLLQTQLGQELGAYYAPPILRWSRVGNMHITLRFLGETTPTQRQIIETNLQGISTNQQPFAITIGELGGFPTLCQPRVIWRGVGGDLAQLNALQATIETGAQSAGFAAEKRAYTAHLTLARAQRQVPREDLRRIGQLLQNTDMPKALSFQVSEIVHMRSELNARGARYTPLIRIPFRYTKHK